MAFMMPVVKNNYNMYPSYPSTRNGLGTPASSRGSSLSSSPTGASSPSVTNTPRSSETPAFRNSPKSGSLVSLHKFHSKLLDKLRKTFHGKDSSEDSQTSSASSATVAIR